jgi:hypothetical protein
MVANMPRDDNALLVKPEPVEYDYLDYSKGLRPLGQGKMRLKRLNVSSELFY